MNEKTKLLEAKHFLDEMVRQENRRDEFVFTLSAFLTSARSVLQYACEEAKRKNKGEEWYDRQVSTNPVVKFFKDKRDANVHQEPVEPDATEITTVNRITPSGSISEVTVNIIPSHHPSTLHHNYVFSDSSNAAKRTWYVFSDWSGSEDVVTLCRMYILELERIIADGVYNHMITG